MSKVITLQLTDDLLSEIDLYAKTRYATRTAYIRHAVIEQLRADSNHSDVRKTMAKQLPQKYIVNDKHEEFGISDEYV